MQNRNNSHISGRKQKIKKEIKLHDCIDKWGIRECHCACRCLGNEFCTDAEKKINEFKTKLEKIKNICSPLLKVNNIEKLEGKHLTGKYNLAKEIMEVPKDE